MSTTSISSSEESDSSAIATPCSTSTEGTTSQPRLLELPVDIFKCVCDHLGRDDAWSLKQVCRGFSSSKVVDELLYREPYNFKDQDMRLDTWKYRSSGRERWERFQASIHDNSRHLVQKLSLTHFASIADFQWVEKNLPNLISLDISPIKDFVWTPEETWTWKQLLDACPTLFARLHDLVVCNWSDYSCHSKVAYSYSYGDYKYKTKFRMTRRRDGSSVPKTILPACTQLKTLSIRGGHNNSHVHWAEWDVHQRMCVLTDDLIKYSPPTLHTLRIYDMIVLVSLMVSMTSAPATGQDSADQAAGEPASEQATASQTSASGNIMEPPKLANITTVEVDLRQWMYDHKEHTRDWPSHPPRIHPGTQGPRRHGEGDLDDGTFESCSRNHVVLGPKIIQDAGFPLIKAFRQIENSLGDTLPFKIKSINSLRHAPTHPFQLINHREPLRRNNVPDYDSDPEDPQDIRDAMQWLADKCDWKPVFGWDLLMCDVFPENYTSFGYTLRPKPDLLSRMKAAFEEMKSCNIPLRLLIGDRSASNLGSDGSLFFGDYKKFIGEGADKVEVIEPSEARFNLTSLAHMVDELTIQYAHYSPSPSNWCGHGKQLTAGEKELMEREKTGWRKFWARYAPLLKNLKKLTVIVPLDIFQAWGKSKQLTRLLRDDSWQMLETIARPRVMDRDDWLPFRHRVYFHKLTRVRFCKRVFFRRELDELDLDALELTEQERTEENSISQDALALLGDDQVHRFWVPKSKPAQKREAPKEPEMHGEEHVAKKVRVS